MRETVSVTLLRSQSGYVGFGAGSAAYAELLSASVWGIYKVLPNCNTSQGYADYFQDSIGWMKAGAIDAITPMIYWDIGSGCTDWSKLLDGFLAGSNGRPVVAGMHALDNAVPQPLKMQARIDYARK